MKIPNIKKYLLGSCFTVFIFLSAQSQNIESNTINVSGVVKDIETGETLPFATIILKGTTKGTTANADGYFTLFDIPSEASTIEISFMGYKTTLLELKAGLDLKNLEISLESSATLLEDVVISAEKKSLMRSQSDKVSVVQFSPKEIAKLPSIGEKDIFRAFQLLPGVSASNEGNAGLFVRGGTPDQNLVLYDGFVVYHVDHLYGMFSAFNTNAIKDVRLYKGGFESKYGGRISSVMEITGKDGNENKFNFGGDLGLISGNVFLETPIGNKVTVLAAARRSWKSPLYNDIFEKLDTEAEEEPAQQQQQNPRFGNRTVEENTPTSYFYDMNAKVTYRPSSKDKISFCFFNGEDFVDASSDINRAATGFQVSGNNNDITEWGSLGLSGTWSRKWNDVIYSNFLVSKSNYFSNRTLTTTRNITNDLDETTEITQGSVEDNELSDFTVKLDNEIKLGPNNEIGLGFQMSNYKVDYNYALNDTISIQDRNDEGELLSVYAQDKIKIGEKLTFLPGIRVSNYSATNKIYYEPRASLNYKITDNIRAKGAWGHYNQFANRIIRNDLTSGSRDFWVLADDETVPVSFSEHFIAGVGYETNDYLFEIEAYYKKFEGLSEYSLQFTPSFNNVNFDEFFYEGTGYSRGIEFLAQKKLGKFTGWMGYTLGEVIYNFPQYGTNDFFANHDSTHEFKIVGMCKLNNWTFAANWIYATGKPYTQPLGGYSITFPDGSTEDFINIGDRNTSRYPDYHRLDFSVTHDYNIGKKSKGSINFSLFNLYNRKNIWYKNFEIEEGDLIETNVNLLGFVPSITASFKLN